MFSYLKKKSFLRYRTLETKTHELNYLFWECTTRCNLNCLHCGSDCSQNSYYADMPVEDFLSTLDTIKNKPEFFTVVITGGEPLLRKDLEICGREIRKHGARWGMVSNGYLYDKDRHIALLNAGLGALTISLDGLEDNHNWLRNSPDSFQRADNAIFIAAKSTRLNFDVVTCVNSRNINELQLIYQHLVARGVKAWRLFTINPAGRAAGNDDLILSPLQFKAMLDFISEKRPEKTIDIKFSCEGYVGKYELKVRDSFFFCRAGINIGSVLIDGSISACPNIDRKFAQGNIYTDNLAETWNKKYQLFRDRSWTEKGDCHNCREYSLCQGNGLHNRLNNNETVICHYSKLKSAERASK